MIEIDASPQVVVATPVYSDQVIAVSFVNCYGISEPRLAIRWLEPQPYFKQGTSYPTTNVAGGSTDWFVLPSSFADAIGSKLLLQKAAGLDGFDETGIQMLVSWLASSGSIGDAMCY